MLSSIKSKCTHAQGIRNLLAVYDQTKPHELEDAVASYKRYHDLIGLVADETGADLWVAVGVFSALSPNNSYVSNLANCRTLLAAAKRGDPMESFKVNTYHSNKRKAWQIATYAASPLDVFKGLKTKAFFLNIVDPYDPVPVTVDGHMYWCYHGVKKSVKHRGDRRSELAPPSLNARAYEEIADAIRLVGELRGVIGCQAQAVFWQTWRRIHGVMGANQMELIASDVFAAGAPNHRLATGGCGK